MVTPKINKGKRALSKLKVKLNFGRFVELYQKKVLKKPIVLYDREQNIRYEFQPGDAYAYYVNTGVFADSKIIRYIGNNIKPGDVLLDVGACFGSVSVSIGKRFGNRIKIYAIEAETNNYHRLVKNIGLNRLDDTIVPLQLAVYSHRGEIQLRTFPGVSNEWNTIGWFELAGHGPTGCETINCISLDELCSDLNLPCIDWLKIDIEVAEPEAFAGSTGLLRSHAIKRIIFEISKIPLTGMGHEVKDTVGPLVDAGYRIYDMTEKGTISGPVTEFDDVIFKNFIALAPEIYK